MPTIKLNSNGKIITKDGKPSCTCCGTAITTIYVEHSLAPWNGGDVSYFTLTGSASSGFTGDGPGGEFTLVYNISAGSWELTDPVYGLGWKGAIEPTDPTGYYLPFPPTTMPDWYATVSLTPLP